MKVTIVGTGYVGLVTGISLAILGNKVFCVDSDKEKISIIKKGKSYFYEPDIEKYLKKVINEKRLDATENLEESVIKSDVTIIAVGTPTIKNKANLSYIIQATTQIAKALAKINKYHTVVIKSTVLPGVTEKIVKPLLEKYSNKKIGEFGLCMNPEFLREGSALADALNPDRIIIGQIDKRSGEEFAKIYKKLQVTKIFTSLATAEMTKYTSNALFATLISFSNEIARISENIDKVDVVDVWKGVHHDRRLSAMSGGKIIKPTVLSYLFSGCGYGGSCFPKDTKALAGFADELGVKASLIKSVININKTQPGRIIILLKKALGINLKSKKIAVLGLTFKPDTDDLRESPAFPVIHELLNEGAQVISHDPLAYKNDIPKKLNNLPIVLAKSAQEAVKGADAAIIITSWGEYIKLPPQFFKQNMKQPILVDGRRIYNKQTFLDAGVIYKGIGL